MRLGPGDQLERRPRGNAREVEVREIGAGSAPRAPRAQAEWEAARCRSGSRSGSGGRGGGTLIVALRLGASAGPAASLSPWANMATLPVGMPAELSLGCWSSAATA